LDVATGTTLDERSKARDRSATKLIILQFQIVTLAWQRRRGPGRNKGMAMISLLIGILIICVVGAICFWAIDKFVRDGRLANLLKLLVVLICLAAILQRVLPLAGIGGL
jgi:hypothetical protein